TPLAASPLATMLCGVNGRPLKQTTPVLGCETFVCATFEERDASTVAPPAFTRMCANPRALPGAPLSPEAPCGPTGPTAPGEPAGPAGSCPGLKSRASNEAALTFAAVTAPFLSWVVPTLLRGSV